MEARAVGKYFKMSASKVHPVVRLVRNRPVEEALARLAYSPLKAARFLEAVLESAVANLKTKGKFSSRQIFITEVFADQGPLVPPVKYRARARGMADRVRNRTCHITVKVEARPEPPTAPESPVSPPAAKKSGRR